jgi:hypothetical protein
MTTDVLYAIDLMPTPSGRVRGDVRFELYEIRDGERTLIRGAQAPAEDVLRAPIYRFEFAPVLDATYREYRVDLVASGAEGVAFWATKGGRYQDGSMHANGRARWADLAFQVHPSPKPMWRLWLDLRESNPVRAYVATGALIGIWLLVAPVVRLLQDL